MVEYFGNSTLCVGAVVVENSYFPRCGGYEMEEPTSFEFDSATAAFRGTISTYTAGSSSGGKFRKKILLLWGILISPSSGGYNYFGGLGAEYVSSLGTRTVSSSVHHAAPMPWAVVWCFLWSSVMRRIRTYHSVFCEVNWCRFALGGVSTSKKKVRTRHGSESDYKWLEPFLLFEWFRLVVSWRQIPPSNRNYSKSKKGFKHT